MNKDNQSYLVVFDGSLLISKLTRYYYTGCLAIFIIVLHMAVVHVETTCSGMYNCKYCNA